ncbi:MAG: hypothetical protein UW86_C0026G0008 [Microgenomates group bacterium GW2011_GWA1_Microgenomates_45_10]|nr:MAG: hypothetical protein UW69_C0015G0026 [Microgenomates group bacterium GW2011_GWA2_44_7]KKT77902.1 MAG: hypothetical protein UW73_C0009G0001 [Microgenomates group bacterium GW2011_GWB1_44_8]KKT86644.1 MAG: hypothetical protein UW86_C0026G0008 [Microgenomates group bacterium GW2011_GWA1_Microgenomates_45_10]
MTTERTKWNDTREALRRRFSRERFPGKSKRGYGERVASHLSGAGMFVLAAQESLIRAEETGLPQFDLTTQLADKLRVMSRSLIFAGPKDVDVLYGLRSSIMRIIYPNLQPTMVHDPDDFLKEIEFWREKGVRGEAIARYLRAICGLVCLDPVLLPKIVTVEDSAAEIVRLEGIGLDYSISAVDQRSVLLRQDRVRTSISNIADFFEAFAQLIKNKYGETDELLDADMKLVSDETKRTIKFLRAFTYRTREIFQPAPILRTLPLLAGGLADYIREHEAPLTTGERTALAETILEVVRRWRVAPTLQNLVGLCAAMIPRELVGKEDYRQFDSRLNDRGLPTTGAAIFAGSFGDLEVRLANSSSERARIKSELISLVPEIIYKIRSSGLSLFNWDRDLYKLLGLDEQAWGDHERRFNSDPGLTVLSPEHAVGNGDCLMLQFGAYAPPTIAHGLIARDMARMSSQELEFFGLLPKDFRGKVVIGIGPNHGDPDKIGSEKNVEVRRAMVQAGLAGLGGKVFLLPKDIYGPTAARIDAISSWLAAHAHKPDHVILVRGTDVLHPVNGTYDGGKEKEGHDRLSTLPTIFYTQILEMGSFQALCDFIRHVLANNLCLVSVGHDPDVHSSYILNEIHRLGGEIMGTLLMTPAILQIVYQTWAPELASGAHQN